MKTFYLFYGKETYLMDFCAKRLKEKAIVEESMDFLKVSGTASMEEVMDFLNAIPLLSPRKVVYMKDAELFFEREDIPEDFVRQIADHSTLIAQINKEPDKRKKSYKFLLKEEGAIHFPEVTVREKEIWTRSYLEKYGKYPHPKALEYLLDNTPRDLNTMKNECDKLIAHMGQDQKIGYRHVEAILPRALHEDVFLFLQKALQGQKKEALTMVQDLLQTGGEPIAIIAALSWQLRLISFVKPYEGTSPREAATLLKQKPFTIEKTLKLTPYFTMENVKKLNERILTTDHAIKTGRVKDEMGLYLLVGEIIHCAHNPSNRT